MNARYPIFIRLLLCLSCFFNGSSLGESYKIEYARSDIPEVVIPPYEGERYTDLVPDTLEIQEMAQLAINGLTGPTNPEMDHELYWRVKFFRNPPVMYHDFNDWCQLKFMEALPLMRVITGSDLNDEVDRVWTDVALKSIGPDGLYYFPMKNRPWARYGIYSSHDMMTSVWKKDGTQVPIEDTSFDQVSNYYVNGRGINLLMVYYLRDKNPVWKKIIKGIVDRMGEHFVDKGDWGYFPSGLVEPFAKITVKDMPYGMNETGGRMGLGLAQFYRETRYKPAGEMARKLVNYLRYHSKYFDEKGRFIPGNISRPDLDIEKVTELGGHYHNHAYNLHTILEYAITADDREMMEYVKSGYEWARNQGSNLIGFFPENIRDEYPTCELCEVADMLAVALKLSNAGVEDYYEDAERWTRNQFCEGQLQRPDWIYRLAEPLKKTPVEAHETADRVAERNVGAFAGWSTANDWITDGPYNDGIMHCCTGNAARSVYYIWQDMIGYEDGQFWVNMLLNRASEWADVYSYIPYEGRVDLKIKRPCKSVLIHAPEWISTGSDQINCTVNDQPRLLTWEGRYVDVGAAKPGEKFVITFPISERTVKEHIGNADYTLIVKGNSVVFIDPPGKYCPLYLRDHYRNNHVRWREIERFVSNNNPYL